MKRLSKEERERAHLCTVPGCTRIWSSDFGRGRVCVVHNQPEATALQVPSVPPQPHWTDDRDEA